jgi:type III restriction enzyme
MKLKFKQQGFQTDSVMAVADCFLGQPLSKGVTYRIDPGRTVETSCQILVDLGESGFKNSDLALPLPEVFKNIQAVQQRQNLPLSTELKRTAVCDLNLDTEMETGTGKTYCYIKTMFELNQRYGWSKFIVGDLEQYKGFVVTDINALDNTVSFSNGVVLQAGEATGDVNEAAMRRIQIREAVKAHFDKERILFSQWIKVLSLFFIDEVAKYRWYDDAGEQDGEYARIFEEEYTAQLNEVLTLEDSPYNRYLKSIPTSRTHEGYFSIDKKSKRMVNPDTAARSTETDDVDAYDLILKKKERLLSFDEPVRFIFSHSALREGWDNPNVFVICALKHSDNTISRRQEVGRGLRLSVNQDGDRMDDPATVHQTNVLTVVANESYKDFVAALQRDIRDSLSQRPRKADQAYFSGKVLKTEGGDVKVTPELAKAIYRYLLKNDYTDEGDRIAAAYHEAKQEGTLAALPPALAPHAAQVFQLIDAVFSDADLPDPGDDRKAKPNPLNANFEKKEFLALWSRINRKAAYTVHFETPELLKKCVSAIDKELKVSLQYTIQRGEQTDTASYDAVKQGEAFRLQATATESLKASVQSTVKYDVIGKLAAETKLTRGTIGGILQGMNVAVFGQYVRIPSDADHRSETMAIAIPN